MYGFASDFDGTLYHHDKGIKKEDILKIKEFQSRNNLFGLCTGRPLRGVTKETEGILDLDFYIVSSGALILDRNKEVVFKREIAFETVNDIYKQYQKTADVLIQLDDQQGIYVLGDNRAESTLPSIKIEKLVDKSILDISLVYSTVKEANRVTAKIKQDYGDRVNAFQNVNSIDIVAKGCSKGTGIIKVKEMLGLDLIYGIGDSFNDLPMLTTADYSFTFHTSPLDVQNKADLVVNSIAEALDRIL